MSFKISLLVNKLYIGFCWNSNRIFIFETHSDSAKFKHLNRFYGCIYDFLWGLFWVLHWVMDVDTIEHCMLFFFRLLSCSGNIEWFIPWFMLCKHLIIMFMNFTLFQSACVNLTLRYNRLYYVMVVFVYWSTGAVCNCFVPRHNKIECYCCSCVHTCNTSLFMSIWYTRPGTSLMTC